MVNPAALRRSIPCSSSVKASHFGAKSRAFQTEHLRGCLLIATRFLQRLLEDAALDTGYGALIIDPAVRNSYERRAAPRACMNARAAGQGKITGIENCPIA